MRNYAWLSNEEALKLYNDLLLKTEREAGVGASVGSRPRRRPRRRR